MRHTLVLPLLLLLGCSQNPEVDDTAAPGDTTPEVIDVDQDGYAEEDDCNDRDASIHPDADEICDGVDNDCDELTDEDVKQVYYPDEDEDGFGDADRAEEHCELPEGWVENDQDCDDERDDVYPGADEPCDDADNDCDGEIDEEGDSTWYQDEDADGFGAAAVSQVACNPGEGWESDDTDCDDERADVYPDAEEICDQVDNDCDAVVDEDVTTTYYADVDADGWGDEDDSVRACELPDGYVEEAGDCDPSNPLVYPDATERCNEQDDDCDGDVDEGVTSTFYADADADSYGTEDDQVEACDDPEGYVPRAGDCDDGDGSISPDGEEICDGVDNDCDGSADGSDATDAVTWYQDADSDGYGRDSATLVACTQPTGYVDQGGDCDDYDTYVSPGATEVCDSIDNDCDGLTDDDDGGLDSSTATTWYQDGDGDGYGDPRTTTLSCDQPSGWVDSSLASDCDDDAAAVNPAATEICDSIDNDCDDLVDAEDDSVSGAATWYLDDDGDGYGDSGVGVDACEQPTGYVASSYASDCDDTDAGINPDADEICDGVDNDCDGLLDDDDSGVIDPATWYQDADGDSFGDDASTTQACLQPSGYQAVGGDCDDGDASSYPGADELCDAADNDCDGAVDENATDALEWFADLDGDGYGDAGDTTWACDQPTDFVSDSTDCDDEDAAVNPAATEICNEVDDDCDGLVDAADDSVSGTATWYLDVDGDGYGDATVSVDACERPFGYVDSSIGADCDDTDAAINLDALEICDSVDNDCDGLVDDDDSGVTDPDTWYLDADGDGFGDDVTTTMACLQPSGYLAVGGDCDDGDASVYPGADEVCDAADNDCDGTVDDDATDALEWFADLDGDGYGDAGHTTWACDQPTDFLADATDCDDENPDAYPGAAELCSGADLDCDGTLPDLCGSCAEHLSVDASAVDGLYSIDLDGSGDEWEVWCDMTTDSGGWTLIQRTVWDWSDSVALWTGYSDWYGVTVGDPDAGSAYRLAGELWPYLNADLDFLVVHVARDGGDTSDCDPLYYLAESAALTVSSTATTISGLVATVDLTSSSEISTTDSGSYSDCVNNYYGVPWFYGGCCYTCPTFYGSVWSDEPHPTARYLDSDADLYGNTEAETCPSTAAEKSYGGLGQFEGVNAMEVYLR